MFKRVDFSAVIFHEASGCVAATVVLWFTPSMETSPLIVVIHHLTTGTSRRSQGLLFLPEKKTSPQMHVLTEPPKEHNIAAMFNSTCGSELAELLIQKP